MPFNMPRTCLQYISDWFTYNSVPTVLIVSYVIVQQLGVLLLEDN